MDTHCSVQHFLVPTSSLLSGNGNLGGFYGKFCDVALHQDVNYGVGVANSFQSCGDLQSLVWTCWEGSGGISANRFHAMF